MVERRPENYRWNVPRVRLFRDELVRILEVFETHGGTGEYRLGEYEFSGLAELDDVPVRKCNTMSFQSAEPYVKVDLRTHGGEVFASSSSGPTARGMADQIRAVLEPAKGRPSLAALVVDYGAGFALGVVLNMLFFAVAQDNAALGTAALVLLLAVVVPWGYVGFRTVGTRPEHVIHLQPRAEHPGFFERNKDQLILTGMSAVAGGVVGWLVGRA